MNVGLAFNPAAFARAPSAQNNTQAQAQQGAIAGGNEFARDKMVRDTRRAKLAKLTGSKVSRKKVLDKAGVTKPAAAKKA